MAGAKKQQSTKNSGGISDKNGNDDSNVNNNENEGNCVIDGSAALALAAGQRRQKRGRGGQHGCTAVGVAATVWRRRLWQCHNGGGAVAVQR
jgi:hypothetical protein